MRIIIIILLSILTIQSSCQRQVLGIDKNGNRLSVTQPVLIVFWGESNAGGLANNADATAGELLPRNLQILHNYNLDFEDLDVGTNNNIGHTGLTCCTSHGMEIGLANSYDAGDFEQHPVYLVKTGQGGSYISQWTSSGAYFDTMRVRIQAAYDQIVSLTGKVPIVEVWGSIGINDRSIATATPIFKAAYIQFIEDVRAFIYSLSGQTVIPFLFTRFDSMVSNTVYETVFGEIDDEVENCFAVSTWGATLQDSNHWDYDGFIDVIVPAFVTIAISYL